MWVCARTQTWYAVGAVRLALQPRLPHSLAEIVSTTADIGNDTLSLSQWAVADDDDAPLVVRPLLEHLIASARSLGPSNPPLVTTRTLPRWINAMGGAILAVLLERRTEKVSTRGLCGSGPVHVDYNPPTAGFVATRLALALPVAVLARLTKCTDKGAALPPIATPFIVDALDRAARDAAVPFMTRGNAVSALGALLTGQTTWAVVDVTDELLQLDIVARLQRLCSLPAADAALARLAKAMLTVAFEVAESGKRLSSSLLQPVTGLASATEVAAIPPNEGFYDDGKEARVSSDGGGRGSDDSDCVVPCTIHGVRMNTSSNARLVEALSALPVQQQVSVR